MKAAPVEVLRTELRDCPTCGGRTLCAEIRQGWLGPFLLASVLSCGVLLPVAALLALVQPGTYWRCTRCGQRTSRWW